MTDPITPEEARDAAAEAKHIPPEVFESFNELIVKNLRGAYATVSQNEVLKLITERLGITRDQVFDEHYLDVEAAYQAAGWAVDYDAPGYNESYKTTFKFRIADKLS